MGVGVPALLRVLRVVHAMAHVEGGAALREAGGAKRVLAAAATRVRFPVCFSPPETTGARGGGGPGGRSPGASGAARRRATPRATPPLSLRAGVEGAPPGPPRMSHAWKFGVRASFFGERFRAGVLDADDEKKRERRRAGTFGDVCGRDALRRRTAVQGTVLFVAVRRARRAPGRARAARLGAAPRRRRGSAGGAGRRGGVRGRLRGVPRVASRALQAALALVESPGATGATRRRAFVRAGGADACAGMLRALALRYEEPRDPPGRGAFREETKPRDERRETRDAETRLGAGELAASCVCLLSALARGGELAGPGASLVSASFLDAALAERATRHASGSRERAAHAGGLVEPRRAGARTSPRWARRSSPFRAPPWRRAARSRTRARFSRARGGGRRGSRRPRTRRKRSGAIASAATALVRRSRSPRAARVARRVRRPRSRRRRGRRVWTPRRAARRARTRASRPGRAGRAVAPRERARRGWRDVETATRASREQRRRVRRESADAATNGAPRRSTRATGDARAATRASRRRARSARARRAREPSRTSPPRAPRARNRSEDA